MRKMKKFAEGGRAERGQARYDRKMADIKKDYEKARAKNPDVARAKMEQRMADAKDDLAKAKGEDRSQTRAAEKAAERALSEARRTKGRSVAASDTRASLASRMEDTPTRVSVSEKVDVSRPASLTPKRSEEPRKRRASGAGAGAGVKRVEAKPDAPAKRVEAKLPDFVSRRGIADYASPKADAASSSVVPRVPTGTGPGRPLTDVQQRKLKEARERGATSYEQAGREVARIQSMSERDKVRARMRELGVPGYAKGGKIDGCAVRGKTRAK